MLTATVKKGVGIGQMQHPPPVPPNKPAIPLYKNAAAAAAATLSFGKSGQD